MISNERSLTSGYYSDGNAPGPPRVRVDALKTEKIQVERKVFILALKENPRGRFLRITEDVAGRYNNIIIPSTGLSEFLKVFDDMTKASREMPSPAKGRNPP